MTLLTVSRIELYPVAESRGQSASDFAGVGSGGKKGRTEDDDVGLKFSTVFEEDAVLGELGDFLSLLDLDLAVDDQLRASDAESGKGAMSAKVRDGRHKTTGK